MSVEKLFRVEDLQLYFQTTRGFVQAVDKVSFNLVSGKTVVFVGESGCGKTSLARAILRLLPRNVHTYEGSVYLNGQDIMALDDEKFRRDIRWVKAAMVPQAAMKDRKSTRLNSSHVRISYAVFCLKKK